MVYNWLIIRRNGMTLSGQADTLPAALVKMKECCMDRFYRPETFARYFVGVDWTGEGTQEELAEVKLADVLTVTG